MIIENWCRHYNEVCRVELPLLVASDPQLCRGGDELEPADLDGDAWIGAVGRFETGDNQSREDDEPSGEMEVKSGAMRSANPA